jgi:16S rRNA (uracil1498-N3)-methyltransferase
MTGGMPVPRFFADVSGTAGDILPITGEDALHISKSLRMSAGETLVLCDGKGTDYRCVIVSVGREAVEAKVIEAAHSESEPDVKVTLYAAVTKGEKMDLVVQKSVELGVYSIVPVITQRCIYQPDAKSEKNKLARWNKIALEASKQSGRGYVPRVEGFISFNKAILQAQDSELRLIAYERGVRPLGDLLDAREFSSAALFTGPEGGYEETEISSAQEKGILPVSLGKRILRAETAPLCALSVIHYQAERNSAKNCK